ncbi:MAG: hypothetical protein ABI647_13590 [Gemmatimonadota bacterium]
MARRRRWFWLCCLAVVAGCADRSEVSVGTDPTAPGAIDGDSPAMVTAKLERGRHERLARRIALALRDPDFRRTVLTAFKKSPFREGKVHLQAFLEARDGVEIRRVAERAGESDHTIREDLDRAKPIELYMPVPDQRSSWDGGANVLVATGEVDADAPVAFDVNGLRTVLDPKTPPSTPVISLVRAEQDFSQPPLALPICVFNCGGGTGSGPLPSPAAAGLYLTQTKFDDTYESWIKGEPELEVHVLGQVGAGDSLTTYQCASETKAAPYYYNQNDKTWTGNVLLMSQTQINQYKQAHPNQNLRVFVVEDDDATCEIRLSGDRMKNLLNNLRVIYGDLTGGIDSLLSPGGELARIWKKASMLLVAYRAFVSLIVTQDDPLGNAIEDPVTAAAQFPGANWVIRGEGNVIHGALRLEVR